MNQGRLSMIVGFFINNKTGVSNEFKRSKAVT
jgi:hypothetical protein